MRTFYSEKRQHSVRRSLKPPDRPETEETMGDLALLRLLSAEPTLTNDEAARELGFIPGIPERPRPVTEGPLLLEYAQSLRGGRPGRSRPPVYLG